MSKIVEKLKKEIRDAELINRAKEKQKEIVRIKDDRK